MIQAYINGRVPVNIPTCEDDITFGQWCELQQGKSIIEAMHWVHNASFEVQPQPDWCDPENMPYTAYAHCMIMLKDTPAIECASFLLAAYQTKAPWRLNEANELSDKIEDMPWRDQAAKAIWLIDKLGEMHKKWGRMLGGEPKSLQLRAGIKKLNDFGDFGSIFSLAGRDVLKMEQVRQLSYAEILTALLYLRRESEYNERYYELKSKE